MKSVKQPGQRNRPAEKLPKQNAPRFGSSCADKSADGGSIAFRLRLSSLVEASESLLSELDDDDEEDLLMVG